jgi:hypothetical protein
LAPGKSPVVLVLLIEVSMSRLSAILALSVLVFLLPSCGPDAPPGGGAATRPFHAANDPQDPTPRPQLLVYLQVYQMSVPFGTVSQSDDFWKHLDEQAIAVATQDLLIKNGLRVGLGEVKDWDYFKKILERSPTETKPLGFQTSDVGRHEIMLKPEVEEQTIWAFNRNDCLEGRTYERSQNVMCLEWRAALRKLGEVNIRLCPMVRALRKRYVVTPTDDKPHIEYVSPERYFDLGFDVDIPAERFLLVAPSREAQWRASLGHHMLVSETNGGLNEQVFLIIPRLFRSGLESRSPTGSQAP